MRRVSWIVEENRVTCTEQLDNGKSHIIFNVPKEVFQQAYGRYILAEHRDVEYINLNSIERKKHKV